ncbi:hypothetical protein LAD12857_13740 [Lacrimispora amygdalina]|uniref:DUF2513 domain-containing protein n=1 Tax=Lacrimispora amygdalina TaxID=253257 RepID=A0ABQ5M3H4_9FIRM
MDTRETIDYCIDSAVKIGEETYDMILDFSDESVEHVDKILDGYHERYLHPEKDEGFIKGHVNTYAHIFGIYVGEVLIRSHAKDYVWQETEAGITLIKNESNHINPITKAYKQIINGKEGGDDIKSFFEVAIFIVKGSFPK